MLRWNIKACSPVCGVLPGGNGTADCSRGLGQEETRRIEVYVREVLPAESIG